MKRKIYTILDNCYTLTDYIGKPILKFSKKSKEQFHHLARIASSQGLVSLSACQIGVDLNMFIILQKSKLITNKWKGYKVDVNDYQVFCNPKIDKFSVEEIKEQEECASVPGVKCLVNRSKTISAGWTNEKNIEVEKELSGFISILFQHEINHCQGKLIIDRKICRGEIEPTEGMKKIMSEKDVYDIHRNSERYREVLGEGDELRGELVGKYQKLMQEVKYSIVERAVESKVK